MINLTTNFKKDIMKYMEKLRQEKLDDKIKSKLEKIAEEKKIAIIGFVAPEEPVRTSPSTITRATIEENEMHRLQKAVNILKGFEKLHLIIHTPGGELHTSYKIARFLRYSFPQISAFVPYEAASGGTLFCCAANELYLGELGNITPIDPQFRYKNVWISTYSFIRLVERIKEDFGEMNPGEVPTPWQQMIDKIDPIVYDEMNSLGLTTFVYASYLLKESGYSNENAYSIARRLTRSLYNHNYQIMKNEAKDDYGFNVQTDEEIMKIYSELVDKRLKEKYPHHCIDHFPEDGFKRETPIRE